MTLTRLVVVWLDELEAADPDKPCLVSENPGPIRPPDRVICSVSGDCETLAGRRDLSRQLDERLRSSGLDRSNLENARAIFSLIPPLPAG